MEEVDLSPRVTSSMSAELTFVDTNVLVYAHDVDAGIKHDRARSVVADLWTSGSGTLSTQVLQELYVNLTRKLIPPMPRPLARAVIENYSAWPVQRLEPDDVIAASEVEDAHRLSFWDALILVAARRSGASRLVTEDLHPGSIIDGVRIESPFA